MTRWFTSMVPPILFYVDLTSATNFSVGWLTIEVRVAANYTSPRSVYLFCPDEFCPIIVAVVLLVSIVVGLT